MWEGLVGKRRRNGIYGMLPGIVVGSILLYFSFYISFLYLLIPVILLVIFHYTKAWRFTDRAFYGFITILVAFFIAMAGISTSMEGAPHDSTAAISVASVTYDIHFNYYNSSAGYIFNFTMPMENVTNTIRISLSDLFDPGKVTLSTNATLGVTDNNYSYSWNAGQLTPGVYIVNLTLAIMHNNSAINSSVEFLGPMLVPTIGLMFLLSESLILSYLLITFLFFLAFAFFARSISMSRKRTTKRNDDRQNPPEQGGSDLFSKR